MNYLYKQSLRKSQRPVKWCSIEVDLQLTLKKITKPGDIPLPPTTCTQEGPCTLSSKDSTPILDTPSECDLYSLNQALLADPVNIPMNDEPSYTDCDCHLVQPRIWLTVD